MSTGPYHGTPPTLFSSWGIYFTVFHPLLNFLSPQSFGSFPETLPISHLLRVLYNPPVLSCLLTGNLIYYTPCSYWNRFRRSYLITPPTTFSFHFFNYFVRVHLEDWNRRIPSSSLLSSTSSSKHSTFSESILKVQLLFFHGDLSSFKFRVSRRHYLPHSKGSPIRPLLLWISSHLPNLTLPPSLWTLWLYLYPLTDDQPPSPFGAIINCAYTLTLHKNATQFVPPLPTPMTDGVLCRQLMRWQGPRALLPG